MTGGLAIASLVVGVVLVVVALLVFNRRGRRLWFYALVLVAFAAFLPWTVWYYSRVLA